MMIINDVSLQCESLSYWYGDVRRECVLCDINLEIHRGEVVAVVGQNGSGKSTLMNLILGTLRPREGRIWMYGADGARREVEGPAPDRGVVYQKYELFPFRTVLQNVVMGLDFAKGFKSRFCLFSRDWRDLRRKHRDEATKLLEKVKLGEAIDKYPSELSGGMKQRVALAQALIKKPEILLLDEPFAALDEVTRKELQRLLLELYRENCERKKNGEIPPYTIIIVTHELEEAILVSDRVIALSPHWCWEEEGRYDTCPGSTVVYDKVARVDLHERDFRFQELAEQANELREAAFSKTALKGGKNNRLTFHSEIAAGNGRGIFAEESKFDFLSEPIEQISFSGGKMKKVYV